MSNLAYKVRQNEQYQPEQTPKTKVIIKRKSRFTLGEKCLGVLFSIGLLIGSIAIISNQVTIYKTNIEMQQIESAIGTQTKLNSDLHVQVQELSQYERLWKKARELGLFLNENNVKVVQGK
ncbi:cell division protein FtsL [Fredinandcohnia quinoae]|uniref:Cell division protein FtsL n=1 Tax=Fredinandcohnia quinoae TaxID=2918902 RepID=A0AAW5DT99_9BACI|nr:cell division protein FtsL [Fredinandcohnia sp. SECRCQ15]